MTSPVSDVKPGSPRWRRVGVIVGVAIAVVAGAAIVVGILTVGGLTRQVPRFQSLAEHPGSSLRGRVLTAESSQGAFDAGLARFALTGANILTPAR